MYHHDDDDLQVNNQVGNNVSVWSDDDSDQDDDNVDNVWNIGNNDEDEDWDSGDEQNNE